MSTVAAKITTRINADKGGARAYTPKDFMDLGSRAGVDQALTRLVKAGALRRIGRGLYDQPRHSAVLGGDAPANLDAAAAAIARKTGLAVIQDDLAAANAMGLTTAVPTRLSFVAARKIADVTVGRRTIKFSRAKAALTPWIGSPAAPIVQALLWARATSVPMDRAAMLIARNAPNDAKKALLGNLRRLPAWAIGPAQHIAENQATKAG